MSFDAVWEWLCKLPVLKFWFVANWFTFNVLFWAFWEESIVLKVLEPKRLDDCALIPKLKAPVAYTHSKSPGCNDPAI